MAERMSADAARALLPARDIAGHKGTYGHLFVIGGSRGMTGAVKLASLAGLRSGAGLVTAGVPHSVLEVVAANLLEIMAYPLPSTEQDTVAFDALATALRFTQGKQAAVLGPGLSTNSSTAHFVRDFCARCSVPAVVDADALNALSENLSEFGQHAEQRILTPHPGEMARLAGTSVREVQSRREAIAAEFAEEQGCVLVLKGHETIVAAPGGRLSLNPTGNDGMATGGTGDVLAGLIGGLLAQGLAPFDAARLGVYLHGLAGDLAAQRLGRRAMIAGDLIALLGDAFMLLEGNQGE